MVDQNNGADAAGTEVAYTPRMRKMYDETIIKAMVDKFGYKNVM